MHSWESVHFRTWSGSIAAPPRPFQNEARGGRIVSVRRPEVDWTIGHRTTGPVDVCHPTSWRTLAMPWVPMVFTWESSSHLFFQILRPEIFSRYLHGSTWFPMIPFFEPVQIMSAWQFREPSWTMFSWPSNVSGWLHWKSGPFC